MVGSRARLHGLTRRLQGGGDREPGLLGRIQAEREEMIRWVEPSGGAAIQPPFHIGQEQMQCG